MTYLLVGAPVVVAVVAWDLWRSARQKRALASGSTGDTGSLRSADSSARAARDIAKGTALGNHQDGSHNSAAHGLHRG